MLKIIKILSCLLVFVNGSSTENETETKTPVTLSSSVEKVIQDHLPLEHQDQFRNHIEEAHRIKPLMDLKSAIFLIKSFTSEFYNKFGVKRMVAKSIPWPQRIKNIIIRNDQFRPGLYYENMHIRVPRYDPSGMNQSYYNWVAYISWNLTNQDLLSYDQLKARELQNSLANYFANLEEQKRKKLYGSEAGIDEETCFKRCFAAIVTRCYKFACNFCNTVEGYLSDLHLNPTTRRFFFLDGIKQIMPTWYFDEEMLDALNILKEARNSSAWGDPDTIFSNSLTFVNDLNETVLLPGFKGWIRPPEQ